jgi:hypothetical protein
VRPAAEYWIATVFLFVYVSTKNNWNQESSEGRRKVGISVEFEKEEDRGRIGRKK